VAGELEKLLIKLEADTLQMRQAMREAEKSVDDFDKSSGRALDRASSKFKTAGNDIDGALRKAGAAIAAYISIGKTLEAVSSAGALARQAELAGLSTQKFQELAFAASQAGIAHDKFSDAAKQFANNISELKTRTGGFYEFLRTALPTVEAQIRGTKDQSAAFDVVISAMNRLQSAAERTTLANKAFGGGGEDLAYAFRSGAAGIRAAADEAKNLGVILDENAIRAAAEATRKYNEFTTVLDTKFKQVVVGIVELYRSFASNTDIVDAKTGKSIATVKSASEAMSSYADSVKKAVEETTAFAKVDFVGGFAKAAEALQKSGAMNGDALKFGVKMPDWTTEIQFDAADKLSAMKRQLLAGDSAYALDLIRDETAQEIEEVRRMYAQHKITAEEYAEARSDANALASLKIKKHIDEENEKIKQNMGGVFSAIEAGLTDPLRDAFDGNMQSMDKYFGSLLKNLALAINQALILKPLMDYASKGMRGSWLASLFAPNDGRAAGGPVLGNTAYVVGEKGPEVFVPQTAGTVIANSGGSSAGGGSVVYNIDARGADTGVEQRIAAVLAEMERRRPPPVAAVMDARRRFPTRG
jgi:hypothetical protein